MKKPLRILSMFLSLSAAGWSALHFYRVRSTAGASLSFPKMLAAVLSPYLAAAGLVGAGLGLLARAPLAVLSGFFAAWSSGRYAWRVINSKADFASLFGREWEECLSPAAKGRMAKQRWVWRSPAPPEPRWQRDIPFWTIPGTERQLFCDVWQPADGTPASGLAFLYFHGSGWHFLDKDVGTRPMFRRLAAQGHVIMDVAYRMCPETDWRGMVGDVKRAIAWMKAVADRYSVEPNKVVLGGGSAGGHLALLAAYNAERPELTPDDVAGADLSVRGVVSWYGPSDMSVYWRHAGIPFGGLVREGGASVGDRLSDRAGKTMGFDMRPPAHWQTGRSVQENMMRALLGGTPDEVPEAYRQASPISYVGPACPPTLLLQGADDMVVSARAVRQLAEALRAAGAPVLHVEYPQTEHAFDIILPDFAPAAQAALYEVERFLALVAADCPQKVNQ